MAVKICGINRGIGLGPLQFLHEDLAQTVLQIAQAFQARLDAPDLFGVATHVGSALSTRARTPATLPGRDLTGPAMGKDLALRCRQRVRPDCCGGVRATRNAKEPALHSGHEKSGIGNVPAACPLLSACMSSTLDRSQSQGKPPPAQHRTVRSGDGNTLKRNAIAPRSPGPRRAAPLACATSGHWRYALSAWWQRRARPCRRRQRRHNRWCPD